MRIAFITPEYPTEDSYNGGLANYLGRITEALAEQNHDVHVFTKSYVSNETINYRGVAVHRVIPLWDLKMRVDRLDRLVPRSVYVPYQDLKAAWALWRRFVDIHKRERFDIAQVPNFLSVGWYFHRLTDLPVVTRLSSFRPLWDTLDGREVSRAIKVRWWMEKLSIKRSKYIYAPTEFVARLTEEYYQTAAVDVIETPFFHEEPDSDLTEYKQYCAGKKYVLFFGRLSQIKGAHLLAQALPSAMRRFPDMNAVFVGSAGPAPDGSSMHDYIRSHTSGVSDRIAVIGKLRHSRLYPILRNAHVVALPSLIDNLPNTCLEAMACGRTVLATTGSCFEQLIVHGQSGILVTSNNVDSLGEGLRFAWELSDQHRHEIGLRASERIAQLHPNIKVPELISYFERIIERDANGSSRRFAAPR